MQRVQATTQRLFSRGQVLGEGDLEDLAPLPRLRHFAREFVVIGKIGQFFPPSEWKGRVSERRGVDADNKSLVQLSLEVLNDAKLSRVTFTLIRESRSYPVSIHLWFFLCQTAKY